MRGMTKGMKWTRRMGSDWLIRMGVHVDGARVWFEIGLAWRGSAPRKVYSTYEHHIHW